jgi:hypothetical protein
MSKKCNLEIVGIMMKKSLAWQNIRAWESYKRIQIMNVRGMNLTH